MFFAGPNKCLYEPFHPTRRLFMGYRCEFKMPQYSNKKEKIHFATVNSVHCVRWPFKVVCSSDHFSNTGWKHSAGHFSNNYKGWKQSQICETGESCSPFVIIHTKQSTIDKCLFVIVMINTSSLKRSDKQNKQWEYNTSMKNNITLLNLHPFTEFIQNMARLQIWNTPCWHAIYQDNCTKQNTGKMHLTQLLYVTFWSLQIQLKR